MTEFNNSNSETGKRSRAKDLLGLFKRGRGHVALKRQRVDLKEQKRRTVERMLTTWAPIGAIAAPVALGGLCVLPALVSGHSTLVDVLNSNDVLKLLATFTALNVGASVSGFMYTIGRHWAAAVALEDLRKQVAAQAVTINHLCGSIEGLQIKDRQNGRKNRDVPNTWRDFTSYLGVNARYLREVAITPAGAGALRLVPDPVWTEMWVDRVRNPDLRCLEFIAFVDRDNPVIAEAIGRSLLRFARLVDEIKQRDPGADTNKIRVYLTQSSEVQRSFFFVTRKVAGRNVDMVLQYSRSVQDNGDGILFDAEAVERITDEDEIRKFRVAAARYLGNSHSTTVAAIRSVFRDLLAKETFRPLSPAEWQERLRFIADGVSAERDFGFGFVDSGSEFQMTESRYPWEIRAEIEERAAVGKRATNATR
jgi:hypothetical protein